MLSAFDELAVRFPGAQNLRFSLCSSFSELLVSEPTPVFLNE
jgi:hypothetical protein